MSLKTIDISQRSSFVEIEMKLSSILEIRVPERSGDEDDLQKMSILSKKFALPNIFLRECVFCQM